MDVRGLKEGAVIVVEAVLPFMPRLTLDLLETRETTTEASAESGVADLG